MKTWLGLCLCLVAVCAERVRYDGYKVLEITVTPAQKNILDILHDDPAMDFWTSTPMYNRPIEIMVPPHRMSGVRRLLSHANIPYQVKIENVQEGLDAEWDRLKDKRDYDRDDYNTVEDIYDELDRLAANCPSGFQCDVSNLGDSYEGREIRVIKIHKGEAGRPAHYFDSTIHAREWLATATNMRVLENLIENYDSDSDAQHMLDNYDFYFAPVINPDGYVFSWESDRMWRKSRSVNSGTSCMGVDLNRNYDYYWGNSGSSTNPCTDTYRGPSAGSEIETQIIQDEADALGSDVVSWTSIHTNAQMWLHSWGWVDESSNCARPDDYDDVYQVAEATSEAVMATHGTTWTYGTICETIYAASGGTIDYIKGVSGVKYTYTPELRGPGFNPPPSAIQPSYEEVWNGIVAMVYEIESIENAK